MSERKVNSQPRYEKAKAACVTEKLKQLYPMAECSLYYEGGDKSVSAWRLLIMARLSAQCTDARVNIVCGELFEKYPSAAAMAEAEQTEVERIVRPCGLYRVKARDLIGMSRSIVNDFGGEVPDTLEQLLSLPGVGRKIANLILGDIYSIPGVVTDTHCIRICRRLGMYGEETKSPALIERIIADVIEPAEQTDFCHRLVLFGREICTARSPRCEACPITEYCGEYVCRTADTGEVRDGK